MWNIVREKKHNAWNLVTLILDTQALESLYLKYSNRFISKMSSASMQELHNSTLDVPI